MKKIVSICLLALLLLGFSACDSGEAQNNSSADDISGQQSEQSEEVSIDYMEKAEKVISSLDYENTGKMGDVDGPAFAVYSNTGFSGASATLDLEGMEIKTLMDDGKHLNGYVFLGIDVYEGAWWQNCVDVGLCWSGASGGWHIFYNMYEPVNQSTPTWYESSKKLPKNDTYVMTLKLIEDEKALLTIEAANSNFKDSVEVEVKGAKKDGSNTAFLFNVALDYPQNTKVDINGKPSENWKDITYGNTDKGVYLKSFRAYDLTLYQGEEALNWTNDKNAAVSIWPDKKEGFDYAPTQVGLFDGTEYYINLDMNRKD